MKQLHYIDKYFQAHLLTCQLIDSFSSFSVLEIASSVMFFNQQTRKNDVDIIDIKWCSFAEVFLILFQRYLFSFNPKIDTFTQICPTRHTDYSFRCISCLKVHFLKKIELDNDFIDGFYSFQNHYWFVKSLSEKYYLSSFDFAFGLQEFGINSIEIGNKQGELIYCDI